MSTLPQDAIDKLPFSAEPMFQWNKDTDIRAFKVDPFVETGGRAVLRATLLLFLPSYFLF